MEEKRERLSSRLGFILLSAGCAIGLGNVWTFPWRVGNNGGGAFLLCYIIALIVIGLPVMTAEFAIGRAAQKSPIFMYQSLAKQGKKKWGFFGYLSLIGNCALMLFYTTIAGYFFYYLFKFITGDIEVLEFGATISNTSMNVICMLIVVVIGFVVLSFNMQKGLEKVTKYIMLALFALMIVLAIRSCTMSGAKEGVAFYLKPDFSKINGNVIIAAVKQAFFSLSLGMGSMAIFGSYIGKDRSLVGESVSVISLDTFVALMAGFIIFPACFTYNIPVDAGPPLLFTTMVAVFYHMPGGRIWGSLFFLFMIFAAMSTVFAVFENILAMVRDLTGWSRKKGCLILGIAMAVLCLPMALEGSVLSGFYSAAQDGPGLGFLDLWSSIVETLIQPLGSVAMLAFIASGKFGWGWKEFVEEANAGKGIKVKTWMKPFFTVIVPILVFALWVYGLVIYRW